MNQERPGHFVYDGIGTLAAMMFMGALLTGLGFGIIGLLDKIDALGGSLASLASVVVLFGLTLGFGALFAVPMIPVAALAYWPIRQRFGPSPWLAMALGAFTAGLGLLVFFGLDPDIVSMGWAAVPAGAGAGWVFNALLWEMQKTT